jgi:hypothetical protein
MKSYDVARVWLCTDIKATSQFQVSLFNCVEHYLDP